MNEITLTGPIEQSRGVIGRYPAPDERYVFEFDDVKRRLIHMVGVRKPLKVCWMAGDELIAERELRPWIGFGRYKADKITEERPSRLTE